MIHGAVCRARYTNNKWVFTKEVSLFLREKHPVTPVLSWWKMERFALVSKWQLKAVPQTRLAGLPHWVPAKVASGRTKVSPRGILWVINAGFVCLQTDGEGAMQMGVDALGNILILKTFTGELDHLLSVLHVLYQIGCRWLIVGVNTEHSFPKILLSV